MTTGANNLRMRDTVELSLLYSDTTFIANYSDKILCYLYIHIRSGLFSSSLVWIEANHSQSAAARYGLVHQHQQIKPSQRPDLLSCYLHTCFTSSRKIKDEFYNIVCSLGCWSHHSKERTTLKSELFTSIRKRKKCKILNSAKNVFYRKMHTYSGCFQPFRDLFSMFSPSLTAIWYMIADILMSRRSSCWDPDTQTHADSRKQ